eukprot:6790894-Pyramimonas_sp.AAC.1
MIGDCAPLWVAPARGNEIHPSEWNATSELEIPALAAADVRSALGTFKAGTAPGRGRFHPRW